MRNTVLKTVSAATSAAFILSALGVASASSASATAGNPAAIRGNLCALAKTPAKTTDRSALFTTGTIVIDGWNVNIRTGGWVQDHPTNPYSTAIFYGSSWIIPLNESDIPAAVNLLLAQAAANPDTGSKTTPGWNESSITKRLMVAGCMYAASGDERLVPVVNELAKANMDQNRYYGPPKMKVHNHGVMADRALLDVAEVMGREDWKKHAVSRLKRQLRGMFDPCGMIYEQASSYQNFQSNLWAVLVRRVAPVDSRFAASIRLAAERAAEMARILANPDGSYEIIGDGDEVDDFEDVNPATIAGLTESRWCTRSGWAIEGMSKNGLVQRSIMRFGPATTIHGHADKGAATWWVGGEDRVGKRVLVDRGLLGKNQDWRLEYARGAEAHSTLLWAGGSDLKLSGRRKASGGKVAFSFRGSKNRTSWMRTITMDTNSSAMKFDDRVSGTGASQGATQLFTLAPGWAPKSPGVFGTSDGWTLTIECSSGGSPVVPQHRSVEHYAGYGNIESAYTVRCAGSSSSRVGVLMSSTLKVERP